MFVIIIIIKVMPELKYLNLQLNSNAMNTYMYVVSLCLVPEISQFNYLPIC